VRLAAATTVHHVVGADELDRGAAGEAWHTFADLMADLADGASELNQAGRSALALRLDAAIADLRRAGARVVAGAGGAVLHVAVLMRDRRRDPRFLFAAG
jgi:hypothetical protein